MSYAHDVPPLYSAEPAPTNGMADPSLSFWPSNAAEVQDYWPAPASPVAHSDLAINPGMTRSAWHRERAAPSPSVLGCARSQECRPFVPRASVERRRRSSLRRFVAGMQSAITSA
jgi:hypothetical protein